MFDDADLDAICTEYLERLRATLADLSPEDRGQIVEQVSEHISSARAALPEQSEAVVRDILERLGTPDEISASAALESEKHSQGRPRRLLVGTAVVFVVVVLGVGIAALTGAFTTRSPSSVEGISKASTPTTTEAPISTEVVPTLLGESLAQAIHTLHVLGFKDSVRYSNGPQPTDTVVVQEPTGGARVAASSEVLLTVTGRNASANQQGLGIVPNVIGQSEADTVKAVTTEGFDVQIIVQRGGVSSPGTVVEEAPVAGSRAASPQAIVVLTVS